MRNGDPEQTKKARRLTRRTDRNQFYVSPFPQMETQYLPLIIEQKAAFLTVAF
jgi:DUF1365 family protein